MKKPAVTLVVLTVTLLFSAFVFQNVSADPDPVNVSWYVTDASGNPIDGASLTIYYSTSPDGPFSMVPADSGNIYVLDRIAGVKQNPIFTGYWNPDYPHGMAVADVHVINVQDYYFYVKVEYSSLTWYWPVASSYKPGNPSESPVPAGGSPSGWAWSGNGIGTGPTTAYPTRPPPPSAPEFPFETSMLLSFIAIIFFAIQKVIKRKKSLFK